MTGLLRSCDWFRYWYIILKGRVYQSLYNAMGHHIQSPIVKFDPNCGALNKPMGGYENLLRYRYKAFGARIPSGFKEFLCNRKIYAAIVLLSLCGMLLLDGGSACVYASSFVDGSKCDVQKGTCTKKVADFEVTLDITPKPVKAMEELLFSVTIKGGHAADNLVLDLAMPGMYMGGNMVVLKKSGDGRYNGKGIIPRCPSGRKLWSATIDIPGKGKAEFLFDVIY